MRVVTVVFVFPAAEDVLIARNLLALLEIPERMEDRVVVGDVDDRPVGEHAPHAVDEDAPLDGAVKVVDHEKPAAQQVLAQLRRLRVREVPLADFDGIEPGPIEHVVAVVEVHGLLDGAGVDDREPPHERRDVPVAARVVGYPDLERVMWAAKAANAREFMERLPLGYDTRVGETGLALSGGQRQRSSIARALYNKPPLLIFDEATSALDTESEKAVKENMDQLLKDRTSFVIAHRLSTIRDADLILVMEKGKIVEQGSLEELVNGKGLYYAMWRQQIGERNTMVTTEAPAEVEGS